MDFVIRITTEEHIFVVIQFKQWLYISVWGETRRIDTQKVMQCDKTNTEHMPQGSTIIKALLRKYVKVENMA